jgi:hypothetical protein
MKEKIVNSYYFRAHTYTIVPRHVREDLQWMADHGTNAVSLAILEQDMTAAVENIDLICTEADKRGISVFAVPSRWCGMVAGAPKVPSVFGATHPETWIIDENGNPETNTIWGPTSSVHHPAVKEFFYKSLDSMLSTWPIRGVIWDEPKTFCPDYSTAAVSAFPRHPQFIDHVKATCSFFSDCNRHIKNAHTNVSTHLFIYPSYAPEIVEEVSKTEALDYFGCDGRPWYKEDAEKHSISSKTCMKESDLFITCAKENGKKSLVLAENLHAGKKESDIMDIRLPELFKKDIDHLIYYYYPRSLPDPDYTMNIIGKHINNL